MTNTGSPKVETYFADITTTDGQKFTKQGTMAEVTTYLHSFVTLTVATASIDRIIFQATDETLREALQS